MKRARRKTGKILIAAVLSSAMLLSGIHTGNVKQEAMAAETVADELPADVLDYQSTGDICLQIPCEERNGIYFFNRNLLSLYDMDTKKSTLVHTFKHTVSDGRRGAEACYVDGNALYVLVRSNRAGYIQATISIFTCLTVTAMCLARQRQVIGYIILQALMIQMAIFMWKAMQIGFIGDMTMI